MGRSQKPVEVARIPESATTGNMVSSNGGRGSRNSAQFDRKLDALLRHAAEVFCAKGFDRASIRDIARKARVSLAGLYYYFSSKEELLFLIQRHAFQTMLASARTGLEGSNDPEERLRLFIRLHLQFFLEHPHEMKVLTHEVGPLDSSLRRELSALKKTYYHLCFDQVAALCKEQRLKGVSARLAVLSLFGMMNWIYQWYNPKVDPDAGGMAGHMTAIFLYGILGAWARQSPGGAKARPAVRKGPRRHSWDGMQAWNGFAPVDPVQEIRTRRSGQSMTKVV